MFSRNPMLRLAIPFILGIAVAWLYTLPMLFLSSIFVVAALLLVIGFLRTPKMLFGVGATLMMFALGTIAMSVDRANDELQWSGEKGHFEALLLEVPRLGDKTVKVVAQAERIGRDSVPGMRRVGLVYLYFSNSVEAEQLQIGERVCFEGKLSPPCNNGNPAEFDVENYYAVKGITGSIYLPVGGWYSKGVVEPTCKMKFLLLRDKITSLFSSLGFAGDELSVLSALTVGEKRDLSKDIKELYASVGASHVLALSGLHVGIFYMIITLLFPFRTGRRITVFIREGVALLLLWCFVAVAGFTPSVLRAAILFTLLSVGRCLHKDNSSLNTLAFAAIVMLLYSPRYLFDVAFQLSFASVFSILLLAPHIQNLFNVEKHGTIYGYIVGILSISIAAQIGVLPFIWYYFGTFPLYFLLTNLLVVPGAFVIMVLALILLLPIPFFQPFVAWILQWIIYGMNSALRLISEIPGASFELPHIGLLGACLVGIALVIFCYGIIKKKIFLSVVSIVCTSIFVSATIYVKSKNHDRHYVLFFNSNKCPIAQLVESREESYVLSSRPSQDVELDYVAESFWRREGMAEPLWLCDDYVGDKLSIDNGLAQFYGRRMMILSDDCWKDNEYIQPVDCLFLCRGFLGSIKELFRVYPATCVVLDATLYAHSRRRIIRECRDMGVRYIDISETGAVKWLCDEPGFFVEYMRGK